MIPYENYSLSDERRKRFEDKKGETYANEYYKEHGVYPSVEQVNSAKTLTEAEETLYTDLFYADYVADTARKSEIEKPEEVLNTQEQDDIAAYIVAQLLAGNKTVEITSGTINNFVIPSGVTVLGNIIGKFQNGATVKSQSSKSFTITHTGDVPIDVVVECSTSVYVRGNFNNIYAGTKSLSVSSSIYPEISGEITFDPAITSDVSVSAMFVGDEVSIKYVGDHALTISNSGTGATLKVYAPNAKVSMGGKYEYVIVNVDEVGGLVLKQAFHAKSLKIKEGNAMYYGIDVADFVDRDVVVEDGVVLPYTLDVTSANVSKMSANAGVYNLVEDASASTAISFGIMAGGKYRYNLNGHTLACGNSNTGCIYLRGSAQVDIYGEGKLVNTAESYGVWTGAKDNVVNVYGGDFEAYTHVLYAYLGEINIYGGSFKLLGNPELDDQGRAKFLLNCYDANFLNGTARIKVYGGKFYNFDPSDSMGEPGGHANFVAEGYHTVESEENGVRVWTVVKD